MNGQLGFVNFTVLCFSLPAKLCSHPADRLAGEMYLFTSINLAVLWALTSQRTHVNETSFTMKESPGKEHLSLFSECHYHRTISLEYFNLSIRSKS